jgi:hypothetical protein
MLRKVLYIGLGALILGLIVRGLQPDPTVYWQIRTPDGEYYMCTDFERVGNTVIFTDEDTGMEVTVHGACHIEKF